MRWLTIWFLTGLILLAVSPNLNVYVSSEGPTESECRPYIEKALNELKTVEAPETEQKIDDSYVDKTQKGVEEESEQEGEQEAVEREEQMLGDEAITEEKSENVDKSALPLASDIDDLVSDGELKVDENDLDGDGIPNDEDEDIDGDGIPNTDDKDIDGDGVPNDEDNDIDGDGIPNSEDDDIDGDGVPNDEDNDIDGDGIPNSEDDDIDGDGVPNDEDNDIDGDGIPNSEDDDIDGDGVPNHEDDDIDGDGIPNIEDNDIDGDGIPNNEDDDIDGDGVPNQEDDDIDGDGILNVYDSDMDGDGIINEHDEDMDGDGIVNEHDGDMDGDGIANDDDDDIDGDGVSNHEDDDLDGDGIPNQKDDDIDGDGIPNDQDVDLDGDGIPNPHDHDIDGDGVPNPEDTDIDGDGIENVVDQDIDGDGIPNTEDQDIDGDGLPNEQEPVSLDIDGDGVPNDDDSDIDGDIISNEIDEDMDGDGIPNTDDPDIDGDGIPNVHDDDKLEPVAIQPGATLPPEKLHKDQEKEEKFDKEYANEVQDVAVEQEEEHVVKDKEEEEGHVEEVQHLDETEEPTTEKVLVDEIIKQEAAEVFERAKRSLESTSLDMDGDGIPDHEDDDIDGDGVPNHLDDDIDGDGVPNEKDEDRDGDGIPNAEDDSDGEADDKKDVENVNEDNNKEEAQEEDIKPEDELLWEGEIPEVRRNRDHIVELLQLGEDSEAREDALEGVAKIILRDIKRIYESAIKPLETLYKYRDLSNRHFSDPEIFSKPLVLFMGPWSGGKSTIINYLTDNEYTNYALRSGAEPSPAYFNILMWGNETEILDGTQLAADYTFSGLQKFGQGLEDRLRGLKMPNKLLDKVNIVEIPGILEVRKQISRLFPFNDACQWFIDRADIIFLVYDPAKLDVGPETEAILDQLKGREYQTRIILNKADTVKPEELLRVQSALIWNISPLMSSAQPPLIYTTSLWSLPYAQGSPARLLLAQERAFLRDLRTAVEKRIENKIASARRFAVRVRNHAKMVDCYLNTYYNHKTLFSNKKRIADNIIENPQNYHIYEGLSTLTNISRYDLPDPEVYRDFFRLNPLYEFKKLSETCSYFRGCPLQKLDVAIAYDLPDLTGKYKKMVEAALLKAELSSQPKS